MHREPIEITDLGVGTLERPHCISILELPDTKLYCVLDGNTPRLRLGDIVYSSGTFALARYKNRLAEVKGVSSTHTLIRLVRVSEPIKTLRPNPNVPPPSRPVDAHAPNNDRRCAVYSNVKGDSHIRLSPTRTPRSTEEKALELKVYPHEMDVWFEHSMVDLDGPGWCILRWFEMTCEFLRLPSFKSYLCQTDY